MDKHSKTCQYVLGHAQNVPKTRSENAQTDVTGAPGKYSELDMQSYAKYVAQTCPDQLKHPQHAQTRSKHAPTCPNAPIRAGNMIETW